MLVKSASTTAALPVTQSTKIRHRSITSLVSDAAAGAFRNTRSLILILSARRFTGGGASHLASSSATLHGLAKQITAVNRQRLFFSFCGLAAGLVIGFFAANSVTHTARQPSNPPRQIQPIEQQTPPDESQTLTPEELRNAINKGDANAGDIALQLNLGRALYLYASHSRDAALLPEALRFIKRAAAARPDDGETNVLLGNVLFDLGQTADVKHFAEARQAYLRALATRPSDPDVLTDVGRTYRFDRRPDMAGAIASYEKALAVDARHEAALRNLIDALLDAGRRPEAQRRFEQLRQINPSSAGLSDLQARLAREAGR